MLLLVNIVFLIEVSFGVLYDGKFFDPKNRTTAECVVYNAMTDYEYLGNVDKSADGESCAPWNSVTETWYPSANNIEKQLKQAPESFYHSKCRTIRLKDGHPLTNVSSSNGIPLDPPITSGKWGPWCFVKKEGIVGTKKFDYSPAVCFSACDETKIVTATERKKFTEHGYSVLKLNYNPKLLDPIDKLFADYQFGDGNYYTYKKSQEQAPEYLVLRRRVFFVLCFVFFAVIIWILACFFLNKYSQKMHRKKQKALEEFFESTTLADIKLQADLRRETEDV
ncbi:unnamed protein product [Caenorhabditis sp. 36 PRJEB53466]|nr:unnamed protein product [Caenorhabditis sp. 36 PRJEB53466]